MSEHVGIQFHAAPTEPQLMTGTCFLSLGGIDTYQKKLVKVHKRCTHMDGNSEQISNMVCVLMNYDVKYCATLQRWPFGMAVFTALTIAKTQSKHRCSQHGGRGGFTLVRTVRFSM